MLFGPNQGNQLDGANDIYCDQILNGRLAVKTELETDNILAFHHTRPSWTQHIVIVPKQHIMGLADLNNMDLIAEIFQIIINLIQKHKLSETGYKVITNGGTFQESKHLHFHLVSGQQLERS